MRRYFAYCTLLDRAEMRRFCPDARPAGTASLFDWRVGFAAHTGGGGCHLIEEPGHVVYGLLYEMDDETLAQLDAISGVDRGLYRQIDVTVRADGGETLDAITYVVPTPMGPFRPSADYVRPILAGASAEGLPDGYVAELKTLVASVVAR